MTKRPVVALVLLMACGGGGSQPTAQALVDGLAKKGMRCERLELEAAAQRELGAREEGHCSLAGEGLTILIYNSNQTRDQVNKFAGDLGAIAVAGDRWVIRTDTDATARRVQRALGGRVVP